jgi:hypothetical protein
VTPVSTVMSAVTTMVSAEVAVVVVESVTAVSGEVSEAVSHDRGVDHRSVDHRQVGHSVDCDRGVVHDRGVDYHRVSGVVDAVRAVAPTVVATEVMVKTATAVAGVVSMMSRVGVTTVASATLATFGEGLRTSNHQGQGDSEGGEGGLA